MDKIIIPKLEALFSKDFVKDEYFFLKLLENKIDFDKLINQLQLKGLINSKLLNEMSLTSLGQEKLKIITKQIYEILKETRLVTKIKSQEEEEIMSLALELKKIYPSGKKSGTNIYWTENQILIYKRLQNFYKKFAVYPKSEEIIKATQKYVNSFNGNYQYMHILKYFIYKDERIDGQIDNKSELLNILYEPDDNTLNKQEEWQINLL